MRRGLPGLLCTDDLLLCGESEEDLRVMVGRFECEVCVDGTCLEHVSEFKYLGCGLDESGLNP